jgi:hypothetical protein
MSLSKQPQSFFVTRDFNAAWQTYCQWSDFQDTLGRRHEVRLAGCRVNSHNCWDVRISQELHDERVKQFESVT